MEKEKSEIRNVKFTMCITQSEQRRLKKEAKKLKLSMTQLLMTLLNQHVNTTTKA